jgi:hypothetical protein
MVIARIRTNAKRITVRVRNGPARTIVARPVVRPKPTLRQRLLRRLRSAKAR